MTRRTETKRYDEQSAKQDMLKSPRRQELLLGGIVLLAYLLVFGGLAACETITDGKTLISNIPWGIDAAVLSGIIILVAGGAILPKLHRRQCLRIIRGEDSFSELHFYAYMRVSPIVIAAPLLGMAVLNIVILSEAFGQRLTAAHRFANTLGHILIAFALLYHRLPNCRRSIKYGALFTGMATNSVVNTITMVAGPYIDSDYVSYYLEVSHVEVNWPVYLFYLSISVLSPIVMLLVMQRWLKPESPLYPGERSTHLAFRFYRFAMRYGPGGFLQTVFFILLRLIPFVGDFYWAARIWTKQRLAQTPVLFLRSFAHKSTGLIFGNIVLPALYRRAVVVTLVHPSQTGAELNQLVHMAWTPSIFSVPNERWEEWFKRRLSTALAVVVDATVLTPSTEWELKTAASVVGADRVAVLAPKGLRKYLSNCTLIEFSSDDPKAARPAVEQWMDGVMARVFETALPAKRARPKKTKKKTRHPARSLKRNRLPL